MNNLLSSAYNRETWIDFLQTRFLPNDFKLKKQTVDLDFKSKYIKPQAFWIGDCPSLGDLAIIEIAQDSDNDARVGVSRDAFRLMAMHNLSRALFVFTSESSRNFRFSLITLDLRLEGTEVTYSYSNPKRFSFYLGEDAKTRTPEEFLVKKDRIKDFADLQSRFSVEAVNKEFYSQIQMMFYKLAGGVIVKGNKEIIHHPMLELPGNPDAKLLQEFSVRLIGRLVFCWFLKKKLSDKGNPLIPAEVLSQQAVGNGYYHRVLEPLFFELLNRSIDERHPDYRKDTFDGIPYLNGGLFDPSTHHDYYIPSKIHITAMPSWSLKIPDDWFREFFGVLETYNFTIDENTPIDIDLSVDPEMLGRIFENLLAEINPETGQTAKNSTGSFYTRRPIVEYMVDESLIQHLMFKANIEETKLRDLLDYNSEETVLDSKEKLAVLDVLDEIRILDPACGSGAFPIGMLQKMLLILHKVDPESKEWVKRQLNKIPNPMVRKALQEKLVNENWKYQHKMGLIQNAIYGVDIQSIATEISKLRLFLSLIVDENVIEEEPNKNIHPLPNLSFKFVTADSLISLGEKGEILKRYRDYIKLFDDIRERYFHAHTKSEKEAIKKEFIKLQAELAAQTIQPESPQISLFDEPEEKPQKMKLMRTYLLKLVNWNPFQDKASDWFDPKWMFGVRDGFDIVIGNPPYIQLQKAYDNERKFADIYENCGYECFDRSGDIYCLFYERGRDLLRSDGHLCFITSNAWMRVKYGKSLRNYLSTQTHSKSLIDFGSNKVFDSATVNTSILIFQNSSPSIFRGIACSVGSDYHNGDSISEYVAQHHTIMPLYDENSWLISDAQDQVLIEKIERVGTTLKDWDVSIYRGILTGCNEAFIIPGTLKNRLIAEDPHSAEIIKPILKGQDIKRYRLDFSDQWVITTHNGCIDSVSNKLPRIDVNEYPALKRHLDSHWDKIEKRADQGTTPYNLRSCAYMAEFDQEKIAWGNLALNAQFSIAPPGYYVNAPANMITPASKYLLAVLNSKLGDKYIQSQGVSRSGGYFEYKPMFVERLPVPIIPLEEQQVFDHLVLKILELKKINENTDRFESLIDLMVYKLYRLSYLEAKLIEPELDSVLSLYGLSPHDYEKISLSELSRLGIVE